jgi:hypothetical protein
MSPGSTRTGGVLEDMVLPALRHGGYDCQVQAHIGKRLGLGAHKVDCVAVKEGRAILISVKWQQVSGTAEQKVPFEVICLLDAMDANPGTYAKAYVVLGGEGWKLRGYYTSGGLMKYISYADKVEILTLEGFIGRANNGRL